MASFLGGPFAAIYVLRCNFEELQQPAFAKGTVRWGGILTAVLLAVTPFMSETFPGLLIPVVSSVMVGQIVTQFQMTRQAIEASDTFDFHSNRRVVIVSLVAAMLFVVVAVVWVTVLANLGLIQLKR